MEHSWSSSCWLEWSAWDGHCCLLYSGWSGILGFVLLRVFRRLNDHFVIGGILNLEGFCFGLYLKGALVGSYKGSCRLYNTSGILWCSLWCALFDLIVWPALANFTHLFICTVVPENKLQQKCQINLQNKKKRSHLKKITGFQVRS